ncbi:MAG: amino acid--tRNA ligase-related protein, partial [Longimicrobiales bacterium]
MEERRSQVVLDRLAKLDALREQGIEPFAYSYRVSHCTQSASAAFVAAEAAAAALQTDDPSTSEAAPICLSLAGRLTSIRTHGKTTFADLSDREGKLQLYLRQADLGPDSFAHLSLLDLGDWIGVDGELMRTRAGEVTLKVSSWQLLSKGVRPLPFGKEEVDEETGEKRMHGGFTDVEQRYRQRYADLAVNPAVRNVFIQRARIVTGLRRFLDERDYIEVETPVLQPLYGGANARPFTTHHNALDMPLFLRIADELYLKRLIVGGLERVYEISKDFRNEGIDRTHNPEFTMLEFYEAFADYEDMMNMVEAMIVDAVRTLAGDSLQLPFEQQMIDYTPPFRRITFMGALSEHGSFDAVAASDAELMEQAKRLKVENAT